MAKMFITGSARGPSTEEFQARIARLAEMPSHTASPGHARKNRPAKPAFSQSPLRRAEESQPEGPAEDTAEDGAPEGPADDATEAER